MGSARRHRKAFLLAHRVCAFCGGVTPSTTVEHCPPRAMFQNRQWPEGFEFPACDRCNCGTSDDDLLIAMLARVDPLENRGDRDGTLPGLMALAHKLPVFAAVRGCERAHDAFGCHAPYARLVRRGAMMGRPERRIDIPTFAIILRCAMLDPGSLPRRCAGPPKDRTAYRYWVRPTMYSPNNVMHEVVAPA
jgi:hypothetical protein